MFGMGLLFMLEPERLRSQSESAAAVECRRWQRTGSRRPAVTIATGGGQGLSAPGRGGRSRVETERWSEVGIAVGKDEED